MEYTKIDDAALRADIHRDAARIAVNEAFTQELERDRQRMLSTLEGDDYEDLRETASQVAEEKDEAVTQAIKLADKRVADSDLDAADVAQMQLEWIETWIEALEREHIGTKTLLELVEGRDKNAQALRKRYRQSMDVIEASHAFGLERAAEIRERLDRELAEREPEPEPQPETDADTAEPTDTDA